MKIKVTKWGYAPSRHPVLVLAGGIEETRLEAEQYFDDHGRLRGFESEMEEDELEKLPEFES